MFTWVIHDKLARGRRPGYSGERGRSVPCAEVDAWMLEARTFGIKSIICLLSDDQLPLYDQLPNGLIAHYRAGGFAVEPVPARDHQYPPLSDEDLQKIWTAYNKLPKPVLVHCSAGVDRTGLAIGHIQNKLQEKA
jgi:protein-tyrosine phosphatase